MIKSIEIENFKCFGSNPPAVVHCAPITLLYGPNSAGKSTVTQALRLMKAQFSDDSPGHNPFEFQYWKGRDGFEWMAQYDIMRHRHAKAEEPLTLTCRFQRTVGVETSDSRIAFVRLRYAASNGVLGRVEFGHADDVRFALAVGEAGRGVDARREGSTVKTIEGTITGEHVGAFTKWSALAHEKELAGWGRSIQQFYRDELRHIGPQREAPSRWCKPRLFPSITTGNKLTMGENGEGYAYFLYDNADSLLKVNKWLSRLALGATVEVQKDFGEYRLLLKPDGSEKRLGLPDMGFGVSQILPIVVYAVAAERATIIVEQPELHIHPKLQAELGDLFIESAKERSNQYIIETHSENLLRRLQRRIRLASKEEDQALSVCDIAIGYVDPLEGRSNVLKIELDAHGRLATDWPGGFFEEGFEDAFA